MPSGFPVTITDEYGDMATIDVAPNGNVHLSACCVTLSFGAEDRERFAQAWVAACHEAGRQASPELCGDRHKDWTCSLAPGHAPLDHAAHDGQGQVCARWPVSDA